MRFLLRLAIGAVATSALLACTAPQVAMDDENYDEGDGAEEQPESRTTIPASNNTGTVQEGDAGPTEPVPVSACPASVACGSARSIGSIDGDNTGSSTQSTGVGSEWLSINVREKSYSSKPIGLVARVTPPAGATIELYLYEEDCNTVVAQSTAGSATPEVRSVWPDRSITNESKKMILEVRNLASDCSAPVAWTLDVQGAGG